MFVVSTCPVTQNSTLYKNPEIANSITDFEDSNIKNMRSDSYVKRELRFIAKHDYYTYRRNARKSCIHTRVDFRFLVSARQKLLQTVGTITTTEGHDHYRPKKPLIIFGQLHPVQFHLGQYYQTGLSQFKTFTNRIII